MFRDIFEFDPLTINKNLFCLSKFSVKNNLDICDHWISEQTTHLMLCYDEIALGRTNQYASLIHLYALDEDCGCYVFASLYVTLIAMQ